MLKLREKYRNQANLSIGVVERALRRISEINDRAVVRAAVEPWGTTGKQFDRAYEELFLGMRIRDDDAGFIEGDAPNLFGRIIAPEEVAAEEIHTNKLTEEPSALESLKIQPVRKRTWGFGLEQNDE